jgi:hypothetical protein
LSAGAAWPIIRLAEKKLILCARLPFTQTGNRQREMLDHEGHKGHKGKQKPNNEPPGRQENPERTTDTTCECVQEM